MRRFFFLSALCCLLLTSTLNVMAQSANDISVTCPNGIEITNAVEVSVNMRPGFTYTATAIGLDGFDPIIGISARGSVSACEDNTADASGFSADLPTTGTVSASRTSAQLPFFHNFDGFEDISIIVGGADGMTGEFVLLLEGMAVTSADGAGDPFSLRLTPNMITSGVNASVYMLGIVDSVDPLVRLVDSEGETLLECDDAGSESFCDDNTLPSLNGTFVSRTQNRSTNGDNRDTMLTLANTEVSTDLDFDSGLYYNFRMTSFDASSGGDYVVVFHVGIGGEGDTAVVDGGKPPADGADDSSSAPPGSDSKDDESPGSGGSGGSGGSSPGVPGGGLTATCPDGTEITNAVEIVVNMRPGFTYTATVVGIDGFDPIIGVAARGSVELCSDDSADASGYEAFLPTTGRVPSSNLSAQMPFNHSFDGLEDISLIVGDFSGSSGEFVLILEGMFVTPADGTGDPFSVRVTPNLVNADIDMSVYMMAVQTSVDPLIRLVDSDGETVLECDDAGNDSICAEGSSSLSGSFVSRSSGRQTPSVQNNAMILTPTTGLTDLDFSEALYLNYLMTSFGDTQGEYVVAFHIGIGDEVTGADI